MPLQDAVKATASTSLCLCLCLFLVCLHQRCRTALHGTALTSTLPLVPLLLVGSPGSILNSYHSSSCSSTIYFLFSRLLRRTYSISCFSRRLSYGLSRALIIIPPVLTPSPCISLSFLFFVCSYFTSTPRGADDSADHHHPHSSKKSPLLDSRLTAQRAPA